MEKSLVVPTIPHSKTGRTQRPSAAAGSALAERISTHGYGKKDIYPWLRKVDSTALQASVLHMDQAYKNFFAGRKGRRKVGFPKFKAKHHSKASYTSKVVGKNIQATDKAVKLPKLGWVKARVSTPVQGRILNATVSMSRSGKFFVNLCCTR